MLILLNATSKNRLLKSIKITACLSVALTMQACSNLYPTKIQAAGVAPPRVWTATEWAKIKEQSAPPKPATTQPAALVAVNPRPPEPPLTDAEFVSIQAIPPERHARDTASVARAPQRFEHAQPFSSPEPVIESNQCWAQMVQQPLSQERLTPVVTREGAISHQISPAVVQQKQQTVTVRDSAKAFIVEPPRFRAVQEQVKISDEIRRITVVPAVYEDIKEEVLVESARTVLQTCSTSGQRAASPDAKTLQRTQCIREIPARYQTIIKKSLIRPETTREEIIPAQYKTVMRWVLEENGRAQSRDLPAEQIALPYSSVQQQPQVTTKTLEAEVRDITVKVHQGMPQMVWRRVLCERELSRPLIEKLQTALVAAGEDLGKPDGKLGPKTWRAIQSYQNKQRLAVGMLSFETLHQLGVSHP
jgi:hypothetical protein